ncbi:NmrA family NAD(P)-binding protein [Aestuariivivens sediminicola]|uniref:NmrA family NAD(P)-binding protein n=1 Tax=Aestuariivivens sediminicola TaxID=2913560 RepID=UPI001F59BC3D|nr:NmrA family NAD(P)-binding protein [Aestuariivivens sediminicola]
MKSENILVIGGTGKTGRLVAENLKELGHNVRVVGRKTNPSFDWDNPETYDAALKDMDRAYVVYYPDLAVPGARDAINALTEKALKAGMDKMVLLSGKGETEAEACEDIVANSGLNYTTVRASWFNQNFSEGAFVDYIMANHMALPMPEAEIPYTDTKDIADVVTKVLLDDSFNGEIVTVTGAEKLTFKEVAEIISKKLGRKIQYQPITMDEFKIGLAEAGIPEPVIWLLGYLFTEVLGHSENQTISDDVERILGRKPISFEEYVEKTVASGVWTPEVIEVLKQ